jgi:hypothetical protein
MSDLRLSRFDLFVSALCPRSQGHDGEGGSASLGGRTPDRRFVGWVDREGLAWVSHRERCLALASGRYDEALVQQFDGLRSAPRPLWYALRHAPLYPFSCLRELRWTADFRRRLPPLPLHERSAARAQQIVDRILRQVEQEDRA